MHCFPISECMHSKLFKIRRSKFEYHNKTNNHKIYLRTANKRTQEMEFIAIYPTFTYPARSDSW